MESKNTVKELATAAMMQIIGITNEADAKFFDKQAKNVARSMSAVALSEASGTEVGDNDAEISLKQIAVAAFAAEKASSVLRTLLEHKMAEDMISSLSKSIGD